MEQLLVIKIGGNIIDDEEKLSSFLLDIFLSDQGKKYLVHGGGKLATKLAEQLGIEQQLVDGRRITDAETLKIVTMVYAGYINKNIVAQVTSHCNAIGLCGADGDAILAHKRKHPIIDYGFVGDVDAISNSFTYKTAGCKYDRIVFAPITHDQKGQLLNTNADTIAQEIAKGIEQAIMMSAGVFV